MPRSSTTWKPGQSGNAAGQVKRPLAKAIETTGNRRVNGTTNKALLADMIWKLATDGKIEFTDGTVIEIREARDWVDVVNKVLKHIDGEAPAQVNQSVSGTLHVMIDTEWQTVKPSDSQS